MDFFVEITKIWQKFRDFWYSDLLCGDFTIRSVDFLWILDKLQSAPPPSTVVHALLKKNRHNFANSFV
jgi:hypothetical protein